MKNIKPVISINDVPETVEVMEKSILAISEGIKKLRSTRLNDKALFMLIAYASSSYGDYPKTKICVRDVKNVIEGIESLEKMFLKNETDIKEMT